MSDPILYTYNHVGLRVSLVRSGPTQETTTFLVDTHNHTGYGQVVQERTDVGRDPREYRVGDRPSALVKMPLTRRTGIATRTWPWHPDLLVGV